MSDANSHNYPDKALNPFATWRIPQFDVPAERLASESNEQLQDHVDVLGAMLFQSRDDILDTFNALADDPVYRAKLGTLKSKNFDALAALSAADRATALAIAEQALDHLINQVAGHLAVGAPYPGQHCVEYSLDSTLLKFTGADADGPKLKALGKCRISDGSKLASSFGRWLNMFGQRRKHV